uniref:SFRICE_010323 n=1 Tax=Spodoptera frugiperda TaxID=7108 RepID=A0A2H1V8A6_SPOFR
MDNMVNSFSDAETTEGANVLKDSMRLLEAHLPPFPIFPIPDSLTTHKFLNPKMTSIALVTPLVFQVSMGSGDCLPSARLPAYTLQKQIVPFNPSYC